MKAINYGIFNGDTYTKIVKFSKAVLWKDRQIPLPGIVAKQFKSRGIKTVIFQDDSKKERWIADTDKLRDVAVYKQVGQEAQFYLPISVFKKERYD